MERNTSKYRGLEAFHRLYMSPYALEHTYTSSQLSALAEGSCSRQTRIPHQSQLTMELSACSPHWGLLNTTVECSKSLVQVKTGSWQFGALSLPLGQWFPHTEPQPCPQGGAMRRVRHYSQVAYPPQAQQRKGWDGGSCSTAMGSCSSAFSAW